MTLLVNKTFNETFVFARGRPATYVDSAGQVATAEIDEPRFDHTAGGVARGLLIEGRPQFALADRLQVVSGEWETVTAGLGTVLHVYEAEDGYRRSRAYPTADPKPMVDACLAAKGRHRLIVFIPKPLTDLGGYVMWRGDRYDLPGALSAGDDQVLAAGEDDALSTG